MKIINLGISLLIGVSVICCHPHKQSSTQAIMAYYMPPNQGFNAEALPLAQLSHIIFSFTEVIDNQMQFVDDEASKQLKQLVQQKAHHPHLKVMIACGGWSGSGGFSDMAMQKESRQQFVKSCIHFLELHQLDGLDLDWEYPGLPGIGNTHRKEDKTNFTALVRELRAAMDATGKKYLLTFASAGWEKYYDFVELDKVMEYVDYMNIMTYDNCGGHDRVTMHHTNLGNIELADIKSSPAYHYITSLDEPYHPRSAEWIINYCLNKGVKPQQIIIGSAFYARGWTGVEPYNNGLYQRNTGAWTGNGSYRELKDKYINKNGFKRHWDEIAKAPYLYSQADSVFITYDDPESVRLKTQYTKDHNLGGIMFWQLRSDAENDGLLNAIHEQMHANK